MDALTFLETVSGYSQLAAQQAGPSASAPVRLAVIDPAYVAYTYPGTLPKVTFEGEDALTTKRYNVVGDYLPNPSDRVVMIPVGHTYVILGPIDTPMTRVENRSSIDTTQRDTTSLTYVAVSSLTATIDLRVGQSAEVIIQGTELISTTGATGVVVSYRVTGASGTREPVDAEGCETGDQEWTPFYRENLYVASVAGSHTFEIRQRAIGSGTASTKNRQIIAKAL